MDNANQKTPSPQHQAPNSSWLKTLSIGFSIISFGITLAIIGYIVLTTKQNQIPTQPSPTSAIDETANWKTYRSSKYGYSFQYPSDWTVIDAGAADGTITEIYSWKGQRENGFAGRKIKKSEILIEIYEIDNPKRLTIQQWYTTDTMPLREKILREEALITISGLSGIKRFWEDNEGNKSISVDLASDLKIYRIYGYPIDTYLKEYEQIVQSFKQP